MKLTSFTAVVGLSVALSWTPAQAEAAVPQAVVSQTGAYQIVQVDESWTSGTVVRVSTQRGKVTIEHGPIENLDMMAMTMPFRVDDTAMLEGLAAGDKIEFVAEMDGKELVLKGLRRPAS